MSPLATAAQVIQAIARSRGFRGIHWEPRNLDRPFLDLRDDEAVAIVFDADGHQLRITAGDLWSWLEAFFRKNFLLYIA